MSIYEDSEDFDRYSDDQLDAWGLAQTYPEFQEEKTIAALKGILKRRFANTATPVEATKKVFIRCL